MKWTKSLLCLALAALLLGGCSAQSAPEAGSAGAEEASISDGAPASLTFTDALGYEVTLNSWDRVVSLYGSFGETWVLAGGSLVGTTSDAIEERNLDLGDDVAVIGSVQQTNFEEVLALDPDFVILSAETASHVDLHEALAEAEIPHAYYQVDCFDDYLAMLRQFCDMTGRDDLYEANGVAVQEQIDRVLEAVEGQPPVTALLIRAFSTGAKARDENNQAGAILKDLGAVNLVSQYESLLDEISMEEVIAADPDYILVTTMGSEEKALEYMAQTLEENPAWAGLTAVQNGHYVVLPKELFHYKPNARWGESYAYLAQILYPELAGQFS